MNHPETAVRQDPLVHSYLFLRRAIGLIGTALPVVLIVGQLIVSGELLTSISAYYYSDMRDVYVGAMCAIGVFLLSYRGYDRVDDIAADIAAVSAIGLALFPTTPKGPHTSTQQVIGVVHLVFAIVFFLTLAYFCLVLFTKTDKTQPTARKVQRNRVYVVSGVMILTCLVLIVVSSWFFADAMRPLHPVLWLESVATIAFGVAWLTKGEAILGD
jgi:hypothetical protein